MNAVDVLRMQLRGSCALVEEHAANSSAHWLKRAYATASLPGFILWHCARIVDWGVNTVVRESPEVASAPEWRERVQFDLGHGAGLDTTEANALAQRVRPDDVVEYAQALRSNIDAWLNTLDATELERIPRLREVNQAHPRYATEAAWEEIKGLEGIPAWQLLMRPCGSHIRMHMGELETLLQVPA